MKTLDDLNAMINKGREAEVDGFNICYLGQDVYDKLEKELDTLMLHFKKEIGKINPIVPCFVWRGVFCVVSELMPKNATMMGWVEQNELDHQKDIAGWPR